MLKKNKRNAMDQDCLILTALVQNRTARLGLPCLIAKVTTVARGPLLKVKCPQFCFFQLPTYKKINKRNDLTERMIPNCVGYIVTP